MISISRFCTKCSIEKKFSCFSKAKGGKFGLSSRCKECSNLKNKVYRIQNPETSSNSTKNWYKNNTEKKLKQSGKWAVDNRERMNQLCKNHRENNKASYKQRYLEKMKDPVFRLHKSISSQIYSCLKGKKNSKSTEKILGYKIIDLLVHLEKQFLEGMTWDNYGKWHVDHITPLASFDFVDVQDPEIRYAWSMANLRPLWAADNIKKRDKILFLI